MDWKICWGHATSCISGSSDPPINYYCSGRILIRLLIDVIGIDLDDSYRSVVPVYLSVARLLANSSRATMPLVILRQLIEQELASQCNLRDFGKPVTSGLFRESNLRPGPKRN